MIGRDDRCSAKPMRMGGYPAGWDIIETGVLKRKVRLLGRLHRAQEFITAICDCPRNQSHAVLSTHANPKAGRDAGEELLAVGIINPVPAGPMLVRAIRSW